MARGVVQSVEPGSIAEEIGLEPGDVLVSVDGHALTDILDYKFLTASDEYELEIQKRSGDIEVVEIVNEDFEELGIVFENGLLDAPKACHNKCMFCFVDQLPKGMRKTLYFKDDDYRLSALMGNYITLTNLTDAEIQRIINLRLPRINVSVHAVDGALRSELLHHKQADVMPLLHRFAEAHITMDCQVVLCRGLNDGVALDQTVTELARLYPAVQSLSVVPVGLTKHREGLPKLQLFDQRSAQGVIDQLEAHQKRLLPRLGTRFVYPSDEFYVKAGRPIPALETYEEFLQLENGVGLLRSLMEEFEQALAENTRPGTRVKQTMVSGVSAAPFVEALVRKVTDAVQVIPIKNELLGESITVTGLVTGGDMIRQLQDTDLGEALLVPNVMLNYDGLFLDDLTLDDVEQALKVPVRAIPVDGAALLECIVEREEAEDGKTGGSNCGAAQCGKIHPIQ